MTGLTAWKGFRGSSSAASALGRRASALVHAAPLACIQVPKINSLHVFAAGKCSFAMGLAKDLLSGEG